MEKTYIPRSTCLVCGDWSYGRHYGIPACSACSSFFKRTIRQRLTYKCARGTGPCVLNKVRRNQCQACRFQKCLEMGMNSNAVQVERRLGGKQLAKRFPLSCASISDGSPCADSEQEKIALSTKTFPITVTSTSEEASEPKIEAKEDSSYKAVPCYLVSSNDCDDEHHANVRQSSLSILVDPNLRSPNDFQAVVLHRSRHQTPAHSSSGSSPICNIFQTPATVFSCELSESDTPSSTSFLLSKRNESSTMNAIPNIHQHNHDSSTVIGSSLVSTSSIPDFATLLVTSKTSRPSSYSPLWIWKEDTVQHETATLLLLREVKWARKLPGFLGLSFCDQVILLEESWNELFLISAIDHCFSTSSDSSSILLSPSKVHNHGVDSTADDVRRNQGDSARDADLSYIRKLIDRFRNLTVDQHEMNFLKAIILFKPFVRGLKDPRAVQKLLEETLLKASDHHRQMGSKQRLVRFFHFLLGLPVLLRIPAHRLEQIYFSSIGGMTMEKFLVNMLVHP